MDYSLKMSIINKRESFGERDNCNLKKYKCNVLVIVENRNGIDIFYEYFRKSDL